MAIFFLVGECQVADFGLLRHASKGETETVNVKGTPHYMAPEAMRGSITTKVDVYCFGAVMLEVLTGLRAIDQNRENRDLVRGDYTERVKNLQIAKYLNRMVDSITY